MQPPSEIENFYQTPDPWGFKTHPDDHRRKAQIEYVCNLFAPVYGFDRALDLGCGEGWITKDLPAYAKHGYEISQTAKSRFPKEVIREDFPFGLFDLVITTGTLYSHYDYKLFFYLMKVHSRNLIVTCHIKTWEREELSNSEWVKDYLGAKEIYSKEFAYREFQQKLRAFKKL